MKNKGFTLIELLVAIAIMGIIVLMALPAVRRVQLDNKDKKYIAYEKTVKTASKLFVDSYDEDLFGYINSGCAKVTYDDLETKKLIEGIQIKDISCKNDNTFVYVMKDRSKNHHYAVNIECRDKNGTGAIVYSHKEDPDRTSCGINNPRNLEDRTGPTVTIINDNPITNYIDGPYNNGTAGNTAKYPKMRLEITDINSSGAQTVGLRPGHQSLSFQWYKTTKSGTSALTGSTAKGQLDVKVRDYYAAKGKADIPVPTADMAKAEPDARYLLKVYGTVTDMDNNKTTMTLNNTTWVPKDYPPSSAGYEVEKESKCPTITWKQSNNKLAVKTDWYNNDLNQIRIEVTPVSSIVARFRAHHYVVKASYNNNSFKNINTNLLADQTRSVNVVNGISGTYKYNLDYYKTAGTSGTKYTCSNTPNYQFDHDNPTTVSITANEPGDYVKSDSHISTYSSHYGYKNKVTIKVTCSDPTSPVKAVYGNKNHQLSYDDNSHKKGTYTTTEDSHGSATKSAKCVDAAGNYSSAKSVSYYVLYYAKESATYCGSYQSTCTGTWYYYDTCNHVASNTTKDECAKYYKSDWVGGGSQGQGTTTSTCYYCKKHKCASGGSCCASKCSDSESYSYSCTKYYSCWY